MVFDIGLFVDILYQIKVTFSFYFNESLYHKLVLDFIRCFCMVIIISLLYFVTMVSYVDWSLNVRPTLHSWSKSNLVLMYSLVTLLGSVCWYSFKCSVLVTQSCLTFGDSMDCNPPGSSVSVISRARILEWVAISFSWGSSRPRDQTWISCIAGRFFTVWATGEPLFFFFPNIYI